jgi:hypothetical protein
VVEQTWRLDSQGPTGNSSARIGEWPRIEVTAVQQAREGEAWYIARGRFEHLMVARTQISDGYRARAHALVALARSWRPAEVLPGARTWVEASPPRRRHRPGRRHRRPGLPGQLPGHLAVRRPNRRLPSFPGWAAPLLMDSFTLAASIEVLRSALAGQRAVYPWSLVAGATAASAALNVAHAPAHPAAQAVAGILRWRCCWPWRR